MKTRPWAGGSGPREVSGAKHECSGSTLSGPPFPHLRTWVAAESFGVKCILGGTSLGILGSGDLGTPGKHPGDGQQVLPSHKGSCMGSGDKVISSTHWESSPCQIHRLPSLPPRGLCVLGWGEVHEWVGLGGGAVVPVSTAWVASMAGPGPASELQSAFCDQSFFFLLSSHSPSNDVRQSLSGRFVCPKTKTSQGY